MNEYKDKLDIENLSEVLTELQKEVQSIKGDVEKLRIAKLIDRLELFIKEMNDAKQDIHQLQQGLEQIKTPETSRSTQYKQSEYSRLQKMLQTVKKENTPSTFNNSNNRRNTPTTEITSIQTNRR